MQVILPKVRQRFPVKRTIIHIIHIGLMKTALLSFLENLILFVTPLTRARSVYRIFYRSRDIFNMVARKKVLVLGVSGMLGHMVNRVLAESSDIDVHGTQMFDKNAPFYFDVMSGLGELEAICDQLPYYDYFV